MSQITCFCRCFTVLLLSLLAFAAKAADTTTPAGFSNRVVLTDEQGEYPLGRHLLILEDPSKTLTIDDVRRPEYADKFVPSTKEVPGFGFSPSAYWVRIDIDRQSLREQGWMLEFGYAPMQWVDVYTVQEDGTVRAQKGGSGVRYSERPYPHHKHVFELTLPAGQLTQLWVRVDGESSKNISLRLYRADQFAQASTLEIAMFSLYTGIILALLCYNLFIYTTLKEISYLYYIFFLATSLLFILSVNGISQPLLAPNTPSFGLRLIPLSIGLFGLFSVLFASNFLETRTSLPKLHILMMAYLIWSVIECALVWIANYRISILSAAVFASSGALMGLVTGASAVWNGNRSARYFLLAWIMLLAGIVLLAARAFGLLPTNAFTEYTMLWGSGAEAILLSIGLAARMRALKEDNERIQLEQLQTQEALNTAQKLALHNQQQALENEQKAVANLQRMDKLKDEFLANTSHELRTPLNGMIGLAEGILHDPRSQLVADNRRHLEMIVSSGRRLNTLVNDILDFSKLRHAELQLSQSALDLHALADVVLTLLKPLANDKGLTLRNTVSTALPAVWADAARVQQILHNLVGNAIKFTPQGRVEVSARVCGDPGCEGWVEIAVSDTGIGIPADRLAHIFESFHQGDGSISREYGGTGLGLSVAQQLVRLHGGEIRVTSEPGQGSMFTFTLPLATESSVPAPVAALQKTAASTEPDEERVQAEAIATLDHGTPTPPPTLDVTASPADTSLPDQPLGHLLVVDDEPVNREVLRSQLEIVGYRVSCATQGVEALAIVLEAATTDAPVDLVLLDVMMPKMSGFEVCRALRQQFRAEMLPILFLTAKNQGQDAVTGFEVGGSDYLTKPFSRDELLARVKVHLALHQAHHELQAQHEHLKATQAHLIQQEKMASLGLLSAGIAHEIKNPVNFMNVSTQNVESRLNDLQKFIQELMADDADPELLDAFQQRFQGLFSQIELIKEGSQRVQGIIAGMRSASRRDETGNKALLDPVEALLGTLELVKASWKTLVDFDVSGLKKGTQISGHGSALNQVFTNLLVNGSQAIEERLKADPDGPRGMIRLSSHTEGEQVLIRFEDNGCGMSDAVRKRLFEPFFTTKDRERGTGLGMGICLGILEDHGGVLEVSSEVGKGTVMVVKLPIIS